MEVTSQSWELLWKFQILAYWGSSCCSSVNKMMAQHFLHLTINLPSGSLVPRAILLILSFSVIWTLISWVWSSYLLNLALVTFRLLCRTIFSTINGSVIRIGRQLLSSSFLKLSQIIFWDRSSCCLSSSSFSKHHTWTINGLWFDDPSCTASSLKRWLNFRKVISWVARVRMTQVSGLEPKYLSSFLLFLLTCLEFQVLDSEF